VYNKTDYRALLFFLVLVLTVVTKIYSQPVRFRHYSTDEGFRGGGLKVLAQERLGFLWVGHRAGLTRFDGYTFTDYNPNAGDSLALPSDVVSSLFVDPDGNLWAGFLNRVSRYNHNIEGFITYELPLNGKWPKSIWFEDSTTLWIATENGLFKLYTDTRKVDNFLIRRSDPLQTAASNSVHTIHNAGPFLLLGTSAGLWKFDKGKKSFSRPPCSPLDSVKLIAGTVKKIFRQKDHYWIWSDKYLVETDTAFTITRTLSFETIQQKIDITGKNSQADIAVIVQDGSGVFWIGSIGLGLIRYHPESGEISNYRNDPDDQHSLPSDYLTDILVDKDQNVWVSMSNKGIAQLIKPSLIFYNHLRGMTALDMVALQGKQTNLLAVTTSGNGLWTGAVNLKRIDSIKFQKHEISKEIKGFEHLTRVWKGRNWLWLGSTNSGVLGISLNQASQTLQDWPVKLIQYSERNRANTIGGWTIHSLYEDRENNLWVGRVWEGLDIVNLNKSYGSEGSVSKYLTDEDQIAGSVRSIYPENDNSFWIGTLGGLRLFQNGKIKMVNGDISVIRVSKASDSTLLLATTNGLYEGFKSGNTYRFVKAALPADPYITAMQEDNLGRLWLATYDGLFFYDRSERFSLVFRKEDGLPSSRSTPATGSAQIDGVMAFGNEEGLVLFDPLSLQLSAIKPRPLITQLKINNKFVRSSTQVNADEFVIPESINTLNNLILDHTQNILVLEFSAMDFTAPEKNQYKHKLENFDDDWIQTDWRNRSATYTNLKPGDYIFKVKASNRDGIWNDHETILKIHVLPPPWKTWWAYTVYGLVFTGILFLARRNIVQRERLASKLKLEHLELEKVQEIDKTKTTFFANISHEFRTPLTLIQGPVQNLLEKYTQDKETVTQLSLIQQNSDRLLQLVNQILELARLESGSLKKEIYDGDLILFLTKIVDSFSSLAFQKKISLVSQLPQKIIRSRFDQDKLEKIISNLLGNAFKFTPEQGAIIINASLVNESKGFQNLLIKVTDTGKGIPPDQAGKIFERFYQVNEDGSPNAGTGIGLALSKELAEFLGGSLHVESKVGEGSKFTLILPVEVIEIEDQQVALISQRNAVGETEAFLSTNGQDDFTAMEEKPLLLIVEDHADLRRFIISCLGSEYKFLEASNGKEGLQQAIDQVPALVISDVMMPEMDGIEMCRKLKQDHRTSHIPVIMLTAKAGDESKLSGLETGADDYLIKPFNKDELVLKIRNQVVARAKMQEKIRLELLAQPTAIKAISADEKFLERTKAIIEERISDAQLSVEGLAEEIGLSRIQLYRKINALTGITVNEFIRKLRLHKAAQLLRQHWGPVAQVAYETGFSNPSYFSKCFKEEFGVLPSEYVTQLS
jgi:signal transduction histidine kinase/DNA-binding response OmpR family regulator/ligand-binding sensor domain-containing protein